MTCQTCADTGVVKVLYREHASPETTCDFGVCLCETGRRLRRPRASGRPSDAWPLWTVWAGREQVPIARVAMLEDLLDPDEVRALGFFPPPGATTAEDVTAAGRMRTERRR